MQPTKFETAINLKTASDLGIAPSPSAAVKATVAHDWLTMHPSGAYVSFTQAGAELFA